MPQTPKPPELRPFFQWLNYLIPYVYTIGILLIVGWMFLAGAVIGILTLREDPGAFFMLGDPTASPVEEPTLLYLLLQPWVESDFNQVILTGLFLLLVWLILFLAIPVAFQRLKRLRFFNVEIEIGELEKVAIETFEVSGTKARLMTSLTSDEIGDRMLEFLNQNGVDFQELLTHYLTEIQEGYKKPPIDTPFTFEVFTGDYPVEYRELIEASKELRASVVQNKPNPKDIRKKNVLVHVFPYRKIEVVTVISSHSRPFDLFDQYLFELLHNTVASAIENYELLVSLLLTEEGNSRQKET